MKLNEIEFSSWEDMASNVSEMDHDKKKIPTVPSREKISVISSHLLRRIQAEEGLVP